MNAWANPKDGPLTREEARAYGRKVGGLTGILGYFGGALGAWAVNFAIGRASDPRTGDTIVGVLAGIAVVMLFAMWRFWQPYKGRPFRMSAGSAAIGTGVSFGAAVTCLLVVVYAGTVILMWVLACAFLIFVVAT
jgi:hypothetical protein